MARNTEREVVGGPHWSQAQPVVGSEGGAASFESLRRVAVAARGGADWSASPDEGDDEEVDSTVEEDEDVADDEDEFDEDEEEEDEEEEGESDEEEQ